MSREIVAVGVADPPFTYTSAFSTKYKGINLWPGIEYETFRTMSQLSKYTFKLKEAYEYGFRTEDGNWTGVIQMLLKGTANMSSSFLTYNEDRAEVIDYGPPLFYFENAALVKSPDQEPVKFVLLKPFQQSVWLAFLLTVLTTTSAFVLLSLAIQRLNKKSIRVLCDRKSGKCVLSRAYSERINAVKKGTESQRTSKVIGHNVWITMSSTLQQGKQDLSYRMIFIPNFCGYFIVGITLPNNSTAYYVLFAVWHVVLLVVVQTYCVSGQLISFLTARSRTKLPFKTMDEFADLLLLGRYRLIDEIEEGLVTKLDTKSNSTIVQKVLKAIKKYPPLYTGETNSRDEYIEKVFIPIQKQPNLAYLGQIFYIKNILEPPPGQDFDGKFKNHSFCDLEYKVFQENIKWMSFGFPKNSSLREEMRETLAGATSFVYDVFSHKYSGFRKCVGRGIAAQLTIGDIQESLWLMGAGTIAAVIAAATEIMFHGRWKDNQTSRNKHRKDKSRRERVTWNHTASMVEGQENYGNQSFEELIHKNSGKRQIRINESTKLRQRKLELKSSISSSETAPEDPYTQSTRL